MRFKRIMFSGAIIFSGYGVLKLIPGSRHDLREGMWFLVVGMICLLGTVAGWLGRRAAEKTVKPERGEEVNERS